MVPDKALSKGLDLDKEETYRKQMKILNGILGFKNWEAKTEYGLLGYDYYSEVVESTFKILSSEIKRKLIPFYEKIK